MHRFKTWLVYLIFGIATMIVAFYINKLLTDYENGDSIEINRIAYLMYSILGKNILFVLFMVIGGLSSLIGIYTLIKSRKK